MELINQISKSEESLWWLVSINLSSHGDNLTLGKTIYFTSRGVNSQKFWVLNLL